MPRGRKGAGAKLVSKRNRGWLKPLYYIQWRENGRTKRRSTGTSNLREAEKKLTRWLQDRDADQRGSPRGPRYPDEATIADVLALYAAKHGPEITHPERICFAIDRLLDWWKDRRVDAVRPTTCQQYREARIQEGVKLATVRRELSTLRAALNWVVKNGYLVSAPFVKVPPAQPGKDRWLERSEVTRLLWEARREPKSRLHLPLFIMLALYTGGRRGALLELQWTQIDFVRNTINLNPPGRAETKKRRAHIPMPRQLRWFLFRAQQRTSSPYVLNYHGEPLKQIKHSFANACARAGLTGVTGHTLRHTCGTWLAQAGVPLWEISGWLGHTMAATTELYAHHHPDHMADARSALEGGGTKRNRGAGIRGTVPRNG